MSFSRAQWAGDFLTVLGNGAHSLDAIDFVVGWSVFETATNSGARYNLLNTTQPMAVAGVSDFNSVGVKNYPDYGTGIKANAFTLMNGRYPALLSALLNNDSKLLRSPNAAMQANLGTWGTGGGNSARFVTTGSARRNDMFTYGVAGPVGSLPPPTVTQSGGPENPQVGSSIDLSWLEPVFIGKMIIGSVLVSLGAYFLIKGGIRVKLK